MEAYSDFARVYDIFMDNVEYEKWAEYLIGSLKEYGIEDGIVLELGCGTGVMTELLAESGYDMIGVDNSEEMLGNTTIAENREEGSFIWENEFDEETGINVYDLTLFLPREDGLYERDEEIHYQKAYDPEKIRELLEKAGLIPLAVYDAYTKDAPKPDSGRLTFVAREHGKGIPADEK